MIRRSKRVRRRKGQAVVEYVILVVVVALSAFFVLTMFSDRLRDMITGATKALGGEEHSSMSKTSEELTKELTREGTVE